MQSTTWGNILDSTNTAASCLLNTYCILWPVAIYKKAARTKRKKREEERERARNRNRKTAASFAPAIQKKKHTGTAFSDKYNLQSFPSSNQFVYKEISLFELSL